VVAVETVVIWQSNCWKHPLFSLILLRLPDAAMKSQGDNMGLWEISDVGLEWIDVTHDKDR
jgi:hypothetical protein